MDRRAFTVLVGVLLVVSLTAPLVATVGAQSSGASSDLTIDELRTDGTHYKKPSARIANGHVYWLTHTPASKPWEDEKDLLETETVRSDEVYLNSIRTASEQKTATVKIAFWERKTRTVETENGTTTETVAANVSVVTREVQLGKGWPTATIDLPEHQEPVQMTMWLASAPDVARWTLVHHSSPYAASAGINDQGDYLTSAVKDFIAPTLVGAFAIGWVVKRALERAGVGPMWGYAPWIMLISIGGGAVVFGLFGSLAAVFVALPHIIAAFTVGVIGVVVLETYEVGVSDARFIKPQPEAARNASGEEAVDARKARERSERIIKTPDEEVAVVRKGLVAFIARVFGQNATLEGHEHLDTRIEYTQGEADELYVVSPNADDVLEYDPEGFEWSANPLIVLASALVAGAGLNHYVGTLAGVGGALGAIAIGAVLYLEATDGYARVEPAPAHLRSAWVSSMYLQKEADEAETLQASRRKRVEEKAKNQKDVEEALEEQDQTLIEAMHSTGGADRMKAARESVDSGAFEFGPDRDSNLANGHQEADDE
ncbi:hypothetical protein [Haloplanus natans]|uniref:hypothetical protein n=1 Tax=Haloplanus natans TaxID=376171 RepID=UPI000677B563|nr:hypothetical protein [Haloplanus natans]